MKNTSEPIQENHIINDNRIQIVNINQQPERIVYVTTEQYNSLLQAYANATKDFAEMSREARIYFQEVIRLKKENDDLKKRIKALNP